MEAGNRLNKKISIEDLTVSLPMPIFLVVEDVGWWQGADGSAYSQPFRNRFPRRHCLSDYRALVRLARRLQMRIALGMVVGEWDRQDILKKVSGSTWLGPRWTNRKNQGPWLDEAGEYLRANKEALEIGCHGLCHEFWQNGRMERSEFHDKNGVMRPKPVVRRHLEAFAEILAQNLLPGTPRIFCPPALHHSFGNGRDSIQEILAEFGFNYVVTCFDRARVYSPPLHEKISWECGVCLLERGLSPVSWHTAAAKPSWNFRNPVLPLHWGNLLHPDPAKNDEVVDNWAAMLLNGSAGMDYILAEDMVSCWSQAAAWYLSDISANNGKVAINLRALCSVPKFNNTLIVKVRKPPGRVLECLGGNLLAARHGRDGIDIVQISPAGNQRSIEIFLQ